MVYKVAGMLILMFLEYQVKPFLSFPLDISLAAFGRKEIEIAEVHSLSKEMRSSDFCLIIE